MVDEITYTGTNQTHLALYIGYTAMHYSILLPRIYKHIMCSGPILMIQACTEADQNHNGIFIYRRAVANGVAQGGPTVLF